MKNLKTSIFFKVGIIIFLVLILLIPTSMVRGLIMERESTQKSAIAEVSEGWGQAQTIAGPVVTVPYDRYVKKYDKENETHEVVKVREYAHFLPRELNINGEVNPDRLTRSIYEVVVYDSKIELDGVFDNFDFDALDIDSGNVHFDQATLNIGITDLKGVQSQIQLNWDKNQTFFNSGTLSNDVITTGINASIPIQAGDQRSHRFSTTIDLKGSQKLYFTPVGQTTNVNLKSPWTTPSFNGKYLPDDRKIDETGFRAYWNVLHLNRNYPQAWKGGHHHIYASSFGTDLLLPVDNYQRSYRVAKYAILFIALTFATFFFVEILRKVFIHPIQYLLVGIALVIFYTLLLSFSEHMMFNLAYVLAAVLTLALVSLYTTAILKSRQIGLLIFGILFLLYTFIFTTIQLESYALLIGSLGMFIILAVVMYFSRKIDWYGLKLGHQPEETEPPKPKTNLEFS